MLQKKNISEQVAALDLDKEDRKRFTSLIDFTNWAIKQQNSTLIELQPAPDLSKAPTWTKYEYLDEEEQNQARAHFRSEGRIGFFVPMKVQRKKKEPELAWFKVFLERDDTISRAENYYIREGITITGIRRMTQRGMRGMVVIDQEPLTTMLGDAENPAHTEWHKDSLNFKGKYEHGPYSLSFVQNSLRVLAEMVTTEPKELDKSLLSDFFSLPELPPEPSRKGKENGRGKKVSEATMPDLPAREVPLLVRKTKDGILIGAKPDSDPPHGIVSVELAYDVRSGNPFRKYSPIDFKLEENHLIELLGAEINFIKDNHLEFTATEPVFEIQLANFDLYRDLKVRVSWKDELE